jgi:hypothetical protein
LAKSQFGPILASLSGDKKAAMMVTTLASIAALLVAFQNTPDDPAKKTAQTLARACAEATAKNDLDKVIDLTFPLAVAAMGGREKAIQREQEALKRAEQAGFKLLSVKEVPPPDKILSTKKARYCVVPVSFQVKVGEDKFLLRSALIGISIDSAKTWKFVDISLGEKNIRKYIPDIPIELEFPPVAELIPEKKETRKSGS